MKIPGLASASKTWKFFFTTLLINILVAGAYSYAFVKIGQENQRVSDLSASVKSLTEQKENLSLIKKTLSDTASMRGQLDGYFVPKDGVVQFLNSVESLGNKNNLDVKILSVTADPADLSPDLFESVKASVEVSGTWSDVYRFASLAELLPFKISASRVDLEKISGETKSSVSATSAGSKKPATAASFWKGTLDLNVLKFK